MDRRRVLGMVGTFALAAVVGTLGVGKTKADAAAGCCCGSLCWCGDLCSCEANCGEACNCCGPDCCDDKCCCDATATKVASVNVVKGKCGCGNNAVPAKAAKASARGDHCRIVSERGEGLVEGSVPGSAGDQPRLLPSLAPIAVSAKTETSGDSKTPPVSPSRAAIARPELVHR